MPPWDPLKSYNLTGEALYTIEVELVPYDICMHFISFNSHHRIKAVIVTA